MILAAALRGRYCYHTHTTDVYLFLDLLSIIPCPTGVLERPTSVNAIPSFWLPFPFCQQGSGNCKKGWEWGCRIYSPAPSLWGPFWMDVSLDWNLHLLPASPSHTALLSLWTPPSSSSVLGREQILALLIAGNTKSFFVVPRKFPTPLWKNPLLNSQIPQSLS